MTSLNSPAASPRRRDGTAGELSAAYSTVQARLRASRPVINHHCRLRTRSALCAAAGYSLGINSDVQILVFCRVSAAGRHLASYMNAEATDGQTAWWRRPANG